MDFSSLDCGRSQLCSVVVCVCVCVCVCVRVCVCVCVIFVLLIRCLLPFIVAYLLSARGTR